MQANVGLYDRVLRAALGIAVIAYALAQQGTLRWLAVIGVILIATAAMRFCPLYRLLGIGSLRGKASGNG